MPKPYLRSRSISKIKVRTPSGKVNVHYESKKNSTPKCKCGKTLNGAKDNFHKHSKSEKKVNRPYGGTLCHSCLERLIKKSYRGSL